jgi:hypothetical protein
LDKGLWLAILASGIYFTFFVHQVMGYGQRFYYPLFPLVLYLAMRELVDLPQNLKLGPGLHFKRIPSNLERMGMVALGAVLLYYGVSYGKSLKESQLDHRFAVFDVKATYRQELMDYWVKLDALAGLPPTLTIATTEVGIPAALYPDRKLYDLAALNEPRLIENGLTARSILNHCAADLIYLPHENYVQFNQDIAKSAAFAERYFTFSALDVKGSMGVAILKTSRYMQELMRLFQPQ